MKELSADQRITPLVEWRMTCRSKKDLICWSKKYLWIEALSAGKCFICRSKKYLICRLKNYKQIDELQIEEVFDLQMKNYLQI